VEEKYNIQKYTDEKLAYEYEISTLQYIIKNAYESVTITLVIDFCQV